MPTKRALIIGINNYPHMAADEQLRGCVNDAREIKKILIQKFNFDPENIIALYDERATQKGILDAMDDIAEKIDQDDIVVFHYSGHGHHVTSRAAVNTEGSGTDNCILPADDSELTPEGKRKLREISDETFKKWLQKIATKTPYTTLIFDCCHSGTMTRGRDESTRARTVSLQNRLQGSEAVSAVVASTTQHPAANRRGGGWLTQSDNYVVIAGCRTMQKSKERTFTRDGQEVRHGALTFHLSDALRQAKPGTTYRDVTELAFASVVSSVTDQNPQLEGQIDREIFGVRDIEPLSYIPVLEIEDDTLTLDGGVAHGLRAGSKWTIYPPGTKLTDDAEKIGVIQISKVGALSSKAKMLERMGPVVVGARCVETEAIDAIDPLIVDLSELDERNRASIESAIKKSGLLAVAESRESAGVYARIITSASALPDSIPTAQSANINGPTWAFFEDEDTLSMPLHSVTERGVSRVLLSNLEKIAKFRNVLELRNQNSTLKVAFNLYDRPADAPLVLANGGNSEFREKDTIVLEIKNNETERPVFFSIIVLNASRGIDHLYPHRKSSEELVAGKKILLGHGENKLRVSFGRDFFADTGSVHCMAIFSSREADFTWLNQQGTRSGNSTNSGVGAFDQAHSGVTPAADQAENEDASQPLPDDWKAIRRSFVITRNSS